jgi:hypothetical protein
MSADFKLPEGIRLDHFGPGRPEEFELFDGRIIQGNVRSSNSKFIVKPAPGYKFIYNMMDDGYVAVKTFEVPIKISIEISIEDSRQNALVKNAIENLQRDGLFVDVVMRPKESTG